MKLSQQYEGTRRRDSRNLLEENLLCGVNTYRLVQKKCTSLAWPAVAGCSRAETCSQLSAISFAQPCRIQTSYAVLGGRWHGVWMDICMNGMLGKGRRHELMSTEYAISSYHAVCPEAKCGNIPLSFSLSLLDLFWSSLCNSVYCLVMPRLIPCLWFHNK